MFWSPLFCTMWFLSLFLLSSFIQRSLKAAEITRSRTRPASKGLDGLHARPRNSGSSSAVDDMSWATTSRRSCFRSFESDFASNFVGAPCVLKSPVKLCAPNRHWLRNHWRFLVLSNDGLPLRGSLSTEIRPFFETIKPLIVNCLWIPFAHCE